MQDRDWVAYIQPPPKQTSDPADVLKYLARYMTGGPISDHRLLEVQDERVTFLARASDKSGRRVPVSLPALEFLRDLCLRCHERLAYPSSQRGEIRGVSGATHNQGVECAKCHKPHRPTLGEKPPIGGKT